MIELLRRAVVGVVLAVLLSGMTALSFSVRIAKTSLGTITVPDDFPTIQEAVNNANEADTVFVRSGTYYENLIVNKSITLMGEDAANTILDGGDGGSAIKIRAGNTTVTGFTVQSYYYGGRSSAIVHVCNNNVITRNIFHGGYNGLYMYMTDNNTFDIRLSCPNSFQLSRLTHQE